MGVEDAMERLQAGSFKSFVARRKAIAKELRGVGDKDAARQVTATPKPSLTAWVLNQLVRGHRAAVDATLKALDAQRDLQLGALSGELDTVALQAAKRAEKNASQRIAGLASAILEEDGHAASKTNLDRVAKGLRAAALDPALRPLLEQGALVREEAAGGFEAVASQLDPAMLLAALNASGKRSVAPKSKVDGMFARSARSDVVETPEPKQAPKTDGRKPARTIGEKKPAPSSRERAEAAERDRAERLAAAKVSAAQARTQIAEQRKVVAACEERLVNLESELLTAKAEARAARRKLGDHKVKLEQAEKRVRLLDT